MPEEASISPGLPEESKVWFQNHGLFSDHFLKERLPEWKEWQIGKELADFRAKLLALYELKKSILTNMNEAQTEKEFIQPVLDLLSYANSYIVQTDTKSGAQVNHPDYALYPDEATKDKGYTTGGINYQNAIGIADAKYWERPLDISKSNERDTFSNINPSFQIINYLVGTQQNWGILTNGRMWRLYSLKAHSCLANYYQIDLVQLLMEAPENASKYFYLFFRKQALLFGTDGKTFLDHILEGSNDYAVELEGNIKERAYQVVESLCHGFAAGFLPDELTSDNLKAIYDSSLILLYRLLFVFYAEARELLPLATNISYRENYSIYKVAKDIDVITSKGNPLSTKSTIYYLKINSLFGLINTGDKSLNVPEYNGGLFSSQEHPFLDAHAIADSYLAPAIQHLARVYDKELKQTFAVDYKTLSERHLGSIYEGLLESKPRIAECDLVVVKEKGDEKYAPASKYTGKKIEHLKGELYLANDKGERKVTGSYYTPEYIVNYIVENTIDPLANEAQEKTKALKPTVEEKIAEWQKQKTLKQGLEPTEKYDVAISKECERLLEPYLSLKVLDPAMGSGHFLARATDYLAETMATDPYVISPVNLNVESELSYYRRRVVESCIYGVDLNPLAVELAKLTLWLSTMAEFKPLSFLNHHLRVGNSLIGAKTSDLDDIPKVKRKKGKPIDLSRAPVQLGLFQEAFNKKLYDLLQNRALIASLPTETLEDVHNKEKWEQEFQHHAERFGLLADIRTSFYFGNTIAWDTYNKLVESLQLPDADWNGLLQNKRIEKARTMKSERHFFHWELEFPEVFYGENRSRKDNPGFDVVVGNPPYGYRTFQDIKPHLSQNYPVGESENVAEYFVQKSLEVCKRQGFYGMILPKQITYVPTWSTIRQQVIRSSVLRVLIDATEAFEDVLLEQVIVICGGRTSVNEYVTGLIVGNEIKVLGVVNKNKLSERLWPIYAFKEFDKLTSKIENMCENLGDIYQIYHGLKNIRPKMNYKLGEVILRGDNISRYACNDDIMRLPSKYITDSDRKRHCHKKVVVQQIVAHVTEPMPHIILMGWFDDTESLIFETLNTVLPKIPEYGLEYLLAIINSKWNAWYVHRFIFNLAVRTMMYRQGYLDYTPIRRISFNTPKKKRTDLFEQGKKLCRQYLETQDMSKVLAFVTEQLPQKQDGTPDIEHEHSDVIHDLLAFLAEEMTRLSKEKQDNTKPFLVWLEKEVIKSPIEDQKNKIKIKEFYESDSDSLLDTLKKNKIVSDPYPSAKRNILENEFNGALTVINPLRDKIKLTDELIDQMVYKLYGLTEEEIAVVEGKS